MNYEEALTLLLELEKLETKGSNICKNGIFNFNWNMPTFKKELNLSRVDDNGYSKLYTIPKHGDVLLSISIQGEFNHAEFFQYHYNQEIFYWKTNFEPICSPFTNGIPLLQLGTPLYFRMNTSKSPKIFATFALLDSESRKELADYSDDEGNGIKIFHYDRTLYKIYDVHNFGNSTNIINHDFSI